MSPNQPDRRSGYNPAAAGGFSVNVVLRPSAASATTVARRPQKWRGRSSAGRERAGRDAAETAAARRDGRIAGEREREWGDGRREDVVMVGERSHLRS